MNERKEIIQSQESIFEKIKRTNEFNAEYWFARDFQIILEYKEWRKFFGVIEKAKEACSNSGQKVADHFVHMDKMVKLGSQAERKVDDIMLSRYACYLIVQNADPSKTIVALGQNYFAIQTRKQELIEQGDFKSLKTEEEKRLFLRNELKVHNKQLAGVAKTAGVVEPLDYAIFQDHGYKGLYGELTSKDIHRRKGL